MKKKIAMLLCATLFCASALTGCSNLDNAGTTASSRSAADSVVATESAAESETASKRSEFAFSNLCSPENLRLLRILLTIPRQLLNLRLLIPRHLLKM